MKDKIKYLIIGIIVIIAIILIVVLKKDDSPTLIIGNVEVDDETQEIQETKVAGYHLVTYNQTANTNSIVKTIKVTASNADNVRFVIGSIDENSFVVERMSFELECKQGENEFDLSNKQYLVKQGEYLFMDDFGQDIIFTQKNSKVKSLIQTEENKNEGKMIVTESDCILPFSYVLEKIQEYKALVIGNDITTKDGGRGLDSTDDKLDYYYLTKTRLENEFGNLNISRINAKEWEISSDKNSHSEWINKNLQLKDVSGLNLVIFQLGDNYSVEKIEDLEENITNFVAYIQKYSPGAELIWIGPWNADEKILLKLPSICEKLNIKYMAINDLYADDYKSLVSENPEVYYPNNEAMQIIANRIAEILGIDF